MFSKCWRILLLAVIISVFQSILGIWPCLAATHCHVTMDMDSHLSSRGITSVSLSTFSNRVSWKAETYYSLVSHSWEQGRVVVFFLQGRVTSFR